MDAMISSALQDDGKQWFVMRDLTRNNAKLPAYRMLDNLKIECFTPMVSKIVTCHGIRERREVPYMHDLLFAHDTREVLDPIVERIPTFQYRYLRHTYRVPMTVRHEDMERFLRAVQSVESPRYYRPEEITPAMYRNRIRIIGGTLDGYEGFLLTMRGSKVKRPYDAGFQGETPVGGTAFLAGCIRRGGTGVH